MATVFPNLLNMGPEIQIQNPASNRDFIVRSLLANARQPFNFTPVTGYPTRAERIAQVREQRLAEEAAKAAAIPQVVETVEESGGPDGPMSNDVGMIDTSLPGMPNFDRPAVVGGLLGGVPGALAGAAYGRSQANKMLDQIIDPVGPMAGQTIPASAIAASLGPFGSSMNEAFEEALDARSDATQTANYADLGYDFEELSIADQNKAAIDPYGDELLDDLPSFSELDKQLSYEELMATGGMSGYGQTFDSLPDIPDTARFDFSDLDEFGNPTVSYDSFSDAFSGAMSGLSRATETPDLSDDTSPASTTSTQTATQADIAEMYNVDSLEEGEGAGAAGGGGPSASDVGNTTAETADYTTFDPDLPDDGADDTGAGSCVIATHAVSTNAFTKRDRAKAIAYCKKKYHGKWYGELFRKGYQHLGKKAIERGEAANHYDEFKNFVAVGRGRKSSFKDKLNFYKRTAQFFAVGCYLKLKEKINAWK